MLQNNCPNRLPEASQDDGHLEVVARLASRRILLCCKCFLIKVLMVQSHCSL